MNLRPITFAVLTLLSSLALTASAQEVRRSYIVQLADKPAASYTGGVAGLAATKPAAGQRLDVAAADVQAYLGYLEQKQNNVLSTLGAAQLTHKYKVVFNGFAALLTDAEVKALKGDPAVAAITADEERQLDTNYTPTFLGLDKADGLWNKQPGGKEKAGDGVIIGIVDGGIWPENKAFADRVDANGDPTFDASGTQVYGAAPNGWNGACETGEGFSAEHCNNKLIGARFFNRTFRLSGRTQHWSDFTSPRDSVNGPSGHGGHGTHTASTAGGNGGVAANLNGIPMGKVSGIAPHARIAAYKVCWTFIDPTNPDGTGTRNSCYNSDSVAAIDQAVIDGVNVINYSISGSQTSVADAVELAFFGAADANVFVAASAGNAGPANTVAHLSPWITTVGASTHNRLNGATVTTGAGMSYTGASLNRTALPLTPAISARDAGVVPFATLNAADQLARRLCYTAADRTAFGASASAAAALDASLVNGKIVLCERGNSARVDKSRAVAEVGGVGMILIDTGTALVSEAHAVPTAHVSLADGTALRTYVQTTANPTVSISAFSPQVGSAPAPVMASFSSRGPNRGYNNILKPDLTAPGVDIIAGVTPVQTQAERNAIADGSLVPGAAWASYNGTSMSSPHVAGLAALLKQLHPTWSPAAIKSALMTTAALTFNDGQPGAANGRLPWAQGAGHVVPNKATDPGLVYDVTTVDYLRYMCGVGGIVGAATCQSTGAIPAYNLNLASLTAGNVLGKLTMTRTVTNVSDKPSTYAATASLPGFAVSVSPATLNLAPGAKGSFNVALTRTDAPMDAYSFGALEWRDGIHVVRSPLTARPTAFVAPTVLFSEQTSGNVVFTVGAGFSGKLGAAKGGLKPAALNQQTVGTTLAADGGVLECRNGGSTGVTATSFTVPPNTMVARFSLRDIDTSGFKAGQYDDLDLIMFNSAGVQVGYSGTATSNEMITLTAPAAGTYRVCVAGYAPVGGSATYTLASWIVGSGDVGGNLKVSLPGSVFVGGTASANASWSGLTVGQRYMGAVQYLMGTTPLSLTLLEVDTTNPVPLRGAATKVAAGTARETAATVN